MDRYNERVWAGQLVAWIKEVAASGSIVFQDATNDAGIRMASGRTKFPDILLFTDKVSGVIFHGWELKFPDTPVDDPTLLKNALEKAERLKSNSFVTWNGREAVIWGITNNDYTLNGLEKIKQYAPEPGITTREDLADRNKYRLFEARLKARLNDILHDLQQLFRDGKIKEAVNVSQDIVDAVRKIAGLAIPQIERIVLNRKDEDSEFRLSFNRWKITEQATLKLLATSSRRVEKVVPEAVLARFIYFKLVGKILFYQILVENFGGRIRPLQISSPAQACEELIPYFQEAGQIDYQAVFEEDFTDVLDFNEAVHRSLYDLVQIVAKYDFRILPGSVMGNILENLVPREERQKFGQYFTPEPLAHLVAFSALKTRHDLVFDPTSGAGTFLNAFYDILKYFGQTHHQSLLNQIWGNDISQFPALLSLITLYKQHVTDTANFPRVVRKDFFQMAPGQTIDIPDNNDVDKINTLEIPRFNAIVSNFPFIQQEDIPNDSLTAQFREEFQRSQQAFISQGTFNLNERSDFYVYCFYNSLKFLENNGYLAAITSNAWLGKNYGLQFKKFLLDNFSIRYVVRSSAEHWFKNAQVSTIFITLQRGQDRRSTKFITLDLKLSSLLLSDSEKPDLEKIEMLYAQIDDCANRDNPYWKPHEQFPYVFNSRDKSIAVSVIPYEKLLRSIAEQVNWASFFIAEDPLSIFAGKLINPHVENIFQTGRGTRTGQDEMYILTRDQIQTLGIEDQHLVPVVSSTRSVHSIFHVDLQETFLFVCDKPENELLKYFPNSYRWIQKWAFAHNKKGIPLPEVLKHRKPYWYSLKAEPPANIFISMGPEKRLFFSYTPTPVFLNQRLIAIRTQQEDTLIVAALLNSIVSLLCVELNGVSRNLGALDLNADFFKTKMKILNPRLLKEEGKQAILSKFELLSKRPVKTYKSEFSRKDRIAFDRTVLEAYGYDPQLIHLLYKTLTDCIDARVNMKNK